jgi:NAD(P)H-hydrate epimerase
VAAEEIGPIVTAEAMAAVDRAMANELAIDLRQIMETAGQAVARFARARFLAGDPRDRRITVLCGSGGNGGDGFVAARVLHGWGAVITAISAKPLAEVSGIAGQQLEIARRCGVPVTDRMPETGELPELVIDALLGFSLRGAPSGSYAALIEWANAIPTPVLSVDLPSGLDGTSGEPLEPCIRATATLTLGLVKQGLRTPAAAAVTGTVVLADVGIPAAAYTAAGISVSPIFARTEWLEVPPG